MIGAIIGDVVGSVYEFDNIKTKEFPLLSANNCPTDDSIMTLAVAEILQSGFVNDRKKIVSVMKKWGRTFINAGYGSSFIRWLISDDERPYNSCGNGAAMRVSAVGWYADSEDEIKEYSKAVTAVTHNHPEGIKGAEVTAMCIYYARTGKSKEYIHGYVSRYYNLDFDYEELRRSYEHAEEICQVTVPQAIYCFLISESFEDCVRTTISIGGDCDTTAAISCAIAEAFYGLSDEKLVADVLSLLPAEKDGCDSLKIIKGYLDRKHELFVRGKRNAD